STKIPPTANSCCAFPWAEGTARSPSPTLSFFFARRWLRRSTDRFSAPITARASEIAYEDWPWPLLSYVDAQLLRLRAPGGLHPRRGASGRLLQPRFIQSAQ